MRRGDRGAPDAAQELSLGADTTKFVNVPLDVIYKYYFRAKRSTTVLPMAQRLQWLQTRDVEELRMGVEVQGINNEPGPSHL